MTYQRPIPIKKADVWPVVSKAFPSYHGRKFSIKVEETITFSNVHWSGGSRSEYVAVRLDGDHVTKLPNLMAPWDKSSPDGSILPLPRNIVVVEHIIFCGKDLGIRLHIHPDNMPRFLTNG